MDKELSRRNVSWMGAPIAGQKVAQIWGHYRAMLDHTSQVDPRLLAVFRLLGELNNLVSLMSARAKRYPSCPRSGCWFSLVLVLVVLKPGSSALAPLIPKRFKPGWKFADRGRRGELTLHWPSHADKQRSAHGIVCSYEHRMRRDVSGFAVNDQAQRSEPTRTGRRAPERALQRPATRWRAAGTWTE